MNSYPSSEVIHKTVAKITVDEKVPHPEYPEIVFDYKELLQFERERIIEIPKLIGKKTINVNVERLLNGIIHPDKRDAPLKQRTTLLDIIEFTVIMLPRYIGRFILDIFGRDKATNTSATILGYIAIIVFVLILQGIINLNMLLNVFKEIWRFFFPIK